MNFQEAQAAWAADKPLHEARGAIMPHVVSYIPDEFKVDFGLAMDAQPTLQTTPNAGIPAFLTTMIDPSVYKILFAPNKAAKIFGERKVGDWTTETSFFPTVEHTG